MTPTPDLSPGANHRGDYDTQAKRRIAQFLVSHQHEAPLYSMSEFLLLFEKYLDACATARVKA